MNPSELAIEYARDVLDHKIVVGKLVRLACERFIKDLDKPDWIYEFSPDAADRAIGFMQMLPHVKGKWAAGKLDLTLEPWQCFIEANLFGWLNKETGKRRFRESYEEVPRKSGKSVRMAARGLYLFCADGESGAEIYSGATSEKQAYEIFRPAWTMANKTPGFKNRFGIELAGNPKNPGPMFVMEDMSRFEPLIGKPGDGASPHAALVDEYHEHDTNQMIDAMKTGMGAREQPMLSIVTTAGSNLGSPCYDYRRDIIRVLEGNAIDESVFGIIYNLDEGDAWDDPDNLKKANPNYDVSVFSEFLLSQLNQARRSASIQNSFRTKHLNEWVGAKTAWMNMVAWQRQRREISIDDFVGAPCHIALDLSSKKDITAVNITFIKDGGFYSFSKFFAPESAAEDNEKYREFSLDGLLQLTDGSMIDHEVIENFLLECNKKYNVIDVAFDEWQADYMMVRAMQKGIKAIKYPFNVRNISEPMKQMEALVIANKYYHDGNAVMTWMVGNVSAKLDIRGNIFPNKDRPSDPRCKIDGVAAALMSLGRALATPPAEKKFQAFFV